MFRKTPLLLLLAIGGLILFDPLLSLGAKRFLLAQSIFLKSCITAVLPFLIFSLLFATCVRLAKNATKIIFFIILLLVISNAAATYLSHFIGEFVYGFNLSILTPPEEHELQPLWNFQVPKLIPNEWAMFGGIFGGIFLPKIRASLADKIAKALNHFVAKLLKVILLVIPFFILGFIVKLQYEGSMSLIFRQYLTIVAIMGLSEFGYILSAYFVINGMRWKPFIRSIRNMIPAMICAFSTMSSAATMPVTMVGVEENSKNKDLAASVVPLTVNIHLLGDCIGIPILIYALLKSHGLPCPDIGTYLIFLVHFVIAKFSVAAVPGGGMIVMIPIIEKVFGFSGAMSSLMLSIHLLMDPMVTCANVLGNGAFAQLIDKILTRIRRRKSEKIIAETLQ